jgi:hypothetical protein
MTYNHTDGRTFVLEYERFEDGWAVELTNVADPMDSALFFDDWRCWAELSDTDWSDVVELDPTASFRRMLSHYLGTDVTGPWQTMTAGAVTVTMGGVQ